MAPKVRRSGAHAESRARKGGTEVFYSRRWGETDPIQNDQKKLNLDLLLPPSTLLIPPPLSNKNRSLSLRSDPLSQKAGDPVPDVTLYGATPNDEVKLSSLGKKIALFAVPGAFTPTCDKSHLPGAVDKIAELKAAGADAVVFLSVNDPFVMAAWGEARGAQSAGVAMLADPRCEFTRALGDDVVLDAEGALGNKRSKRYSAVIVDGKFSAFNLEGGGGTGLSCSAAGDDLVKQLKEAA